MNTIPRERRRRFGRLASAEGLGTLSPAMETADRYFAWIYEAFAPHLRGRVLEVGSGYGVFASVLAARHEDVVATDMDPASVRVLERRFAGNARVRVRRLDVLDEASVDEVAREGIDVALSQNVLEHIEDDVAALGNMRKVVKPGGTVLVFVPALEAIYGSLDRLAGHHRRYDRAILRERLEAAGLVVEEIRFFNFIGAFGWFVNACLVPQMRLDDPAVNGQVRIYDRYVVPASAALERLIAPPFGQSLVAVAKRPG